MTPKQKNQFIDLLLACPMMRERAQRDRVVADLLEEIRVRINRHEVDTADVAGILNTCLLFPDGLEQLIDSLYFFEKFSPQMQVVLQFQREFRNWPNVLSPRPKIEFDWVRIPAGSFIMGSNDGLYANGLDNEKPVHEVYLPEYYVAHVPVTNEQWVIFLQESGYQWQGLDRWWHWIHQNKSRQHVESKKASSLCLPPGKEKHPVVYVNWYDAVVFCDWANTLTPAPRPLGEGQIKLPTEAEWEKTARGTDGWKYPWGNSAPTDQLCNFYQNIDYTTPVGAYPKGASPYGALDMAGNVWEWCSSSYQPYPYRVDDGRENIDKLGDNIIVLRGGSWFNGTVLLRCAYRFKLYPYVNVNAVGFRCFCVPNF